MRKIKKAYRSKKLNKTEVYIKQNQGKKIGLFLPTLKQYQNMTNEGRALVRKAITKLKNIHHPTEQALGFDSLMTMAKTGMYGQTTPKRYIKQSRAMGALKTMLEHEKVSKKYAKSKGIAIEAGLPKKEQFKYGAYDRKAESPIVKNFVNYMESSKKNLEVKSDEVAAHMSEFDYYRVKGGYIIVRKKERSFVKFNYTSREAYEYVINHNAMEASEWF